MHCSALIVDDEPLARRRLRTMLEEKYSSEIEILEEACSGEQAIERIKDYAPDVVFLDIQMPDMDAFEVLNSLEKDDVPLIIFTTAFDNFALRAFDENTVDYVLKPISPERLDSAIEKLRKFFPEVEESVPETGLTWEKLKSLVEVNTNYLRRIQVRIGDRIVLVKLDKVIRFHSEEKYTVIYTENNQFIINTPLVELEKRLDPHQFVRIHRSNMVSLDHVLEFRRTENGKLLAVMDDLNHTQLLVSRNLFKKIQDL